MHLLAGTCIRETLCRALDLIVIVQYALAFKHPWAKTPNAVRSLYDKRQAILSHISYFGLGPDTPAPITDGSSSLPMLYNSPITNEMREMKKTVVPARSQNGAAMSFFWHAPPP